MIAWLQSEGERATAEGYRLLQVAGEMSWVQRDGQRVKRLVEYEAKLHATIPAPAAPLTESGLIHISGFLQPIVGTRREAT